jgi:alpha-1,6-mannosyltransferase
VPAAMGIIYVAWDWNGPGVPLRQRVQPLLKSAAVAFSVMMTLSLVTGLGWGWIANLGTPGTVRSWMAPATAIGLVISGALHVLHVGVGLGGVLTVTRALGLLTATIIAGYCLRHSDRMGVLRALGISMLMFVLLGPVVQPWYLTWGIILMAPVVAGRMRTFVLALSMVAPFIGLTGGASLLNQLVHTNPLSMVVAVVVLWGIVIMPLGRWTTSWRIDTDRLKSALPAPHVPEAAFDS